VWIDPLFAFAGCDLLNAEKTGRFLREGLFPIAVKCNVCLQVIHHVGKPNRDDKDHRTDIDFQYLGFGTSEIQNAFRAINILIPVPKTDVFRLILSKRGERAGGHTPDGEWTRNIYLQHSREGICWLQCDKPAEEEPAKGRPIKYTKEQILEYMTLDGVRTSTLCKHVRRETGMSQKTFYRLWLDLKEAGKIRVDQEELWYPK